jgi:hypothetical protein
MKIFKNQAVLETNDSFSRRHPLSLELQACHLNHNIRCLAMQMAMHEFLKMTWGNQSLKSGETDVFFSFPNLLTTSQHPHNSLSRCRCSLLVPFIFLKHPDASFSQSKPLSQLPNRHGPLLRLRPRLRFRSLSFFKDTLLLNSNSVVKKVVFVVGFQRLEVIFSILSTN